MRLKTPEVLFFSCFFVWLFNCQAAWAINAGPQKKALIIAVGNYPEVGGWHKINAANDVLLIRDVLAKQGFPEDQITVLQDKQADKAGILQAIKQLIRTTGNGDMVFLHFSTHGQQIFDDNEDEFDSFDEAIVPYDAFKNYQDNGYTGDKHLRDDELGTLLAQLSAKVGASGSILVTLDACHSGSGTRGNLQAAARGTQTPFAPPGFRPRQSAAVAGEKWFGPGFVNPGNKPAEHAPVVVISATGEDQLNYEVPYGQGKKVGSLSYALAKTLSTARNQLSHQALFDEINIVMRGIVPNQTPEIEGSANTEIFSGKMVIQTPYFLPTYLEPGIISIPAGQLMHIFPGTVVALYPIGTTSPQKDAGNKRMTTGRVIKSSFLSAEIKLDKPLLVDETEKSWVFIQEQHFGGIQLTVNIDLPQKPALGTALTKALSELKTVQLTSSHTADLVIDDFASTTGQERGTDIVMSKKEKEIYRVPFREADTEKLVKEIVNRINYTLKANYLINNLVLQDESMKVDLELLPVAVDENNSITSILNKKGYMHNGVLHLKEQDRVILKIANKGMQRVYFTIIDIQPDDRINIVVPYPGTEPKDFWLEAGDMRKIEGFPAQPLLVSAPYGDEVFKVIATAQPIDLRQIIQETDTRSTDSLNPFEVLLNNASSQRSTAFDMGPPDAAYVETILFKIMPRQ